MSAFSDDTDPELRKYAPKWSSEQPAKPNVEQLRQVSTSASTVPSFEEGNQNRPISRLWPSPVPEPPAQREGGLLALMERFVRAAAFAIVVASLAIFGKPLLQRVGLLEPDSPPIQVSKPADPRLTANDAPANRALVPAAGIGAAPVAASSATAQTQQVPLSPAQGQQAALSPISKPVGQESNVSGAVRGVTDSEIGLEFPRHSLALPRNSASI